MNKVLLTFFALLGFCATVQAQQPTITAIDKVSGGMTELLAIQGSGFGTNSTVFFGAMKGTIETISDQLIEVHIPHGATYENISVTNLTSGLTAYSKPHFLLSFGADFGFNLTNLVGQTDFNAGAGLYNFCMCDFNADNKIDVVSTNDNGLAAQTTITVHTNTSSGPGNINFANSTISVGARTFHTKCGDLNGDGKPDLVVTEGSSGTSDRIFILQNNSSGAISFLPPLIIKQTGKNNKHIEIADLDLDGKPELIITNQAGIKISIFVNQSAGAIAFSPTPLEISITGVIATDALAVEDLNGDDLPEIVTAQYLSSGKIYFTENKSTPGSITFGEIQSIDTHDVFLSLKVGDLNGDGKAEIVGTKSKVPNDIFMFMNTSVGTAITFAAFKRVPVDGVPWGIDFGDLDGDGRPDIVVASVSQKSITILNNLSTTTTLDFQQHIKPTTYINRHINIGDLDGDGKPDVVFTSVDDINNGIPASKLSVFRNKSCMIPVITPEGPLTICTGVPLELFSTVSRGVTYDWKLNGATQGSPGTNPVYINPNPDGTDAGNYTVTATAEGGTCSEISEPVTVNVSGTASGPVSIDPFDPVCAGGTLFLKANFGGLGAATFNWTGPDGYTSPGASISRNNFTAEKSGRYYVDVTVGSCLYQRLSVVTSLVSSDFPLTYPGGEVICQGETKLLTVPNVPDFSYQWYKDNVSIPLATGNTYLASASGKYSVKINYTLGVGCAEVEPSVTLTVVSLPIAQFVSNPPTTACENQRVDFTNQSTTDPSANPVFSWDFGGNGTSTEKNPSHIFTGISVDTSFPVKLTVSYPGNAACTALITKPILITENATPVITNPNNKYNFCDGDSLRLEVLGAYTSYLWSTGDQTSFTYVKNNSPVTVDVKATNGCPLTATRNNIITDPAPAVLISATPSQITEGQTSQLEATGLNNYTWTPADGLSSTTIFNPLASPLVTTTYAVTGTTTGFSCPGNESITIEVKGEPIVDKLIPSKFISPNQDAENQVWIVERIDEFDNCGVTIYDDKGVKVFEAKPYQNNWDGTFNGQKLPDGVYYYIIRCDGEENKPRTGSITVLR